MLISNMHPTRPQTNSFPRHRVFYINEPNDHQDNVNINLSKQNLTFQTCHHW